MKFVAKLRQQGTSIIITVPTTVVEGLELKTGEIACFDIEPTQKGGDE